MAVSPRRRALVFAVLVSLLLHVSAGISLFLVADPQVEAARSDGLQVDACDLGPEENARTYLAGNRKTEPMQAVLLAPPSVVESAPPEQAPIETVIQIAQPTEAPTNDGPSASQGSQAGPGFEAVRHGAGPRFFDVEAQGRTFVYVIDRSSSMGPRGGLRAARQELMSSLQQLPPAARFQVIVYNRVAEPLLPDRPSMLEVTPESLERIAERLSGLRAEGGTDHLPALRRGLALRPDVIFFLTDADDLTNDLLRAVTRLNPGRHTIIHAIELNALNRDRPDMPMHVLARENGGTYRAVDLR
jgi:von Willebrand factor type A domain